MKRPNLYSRVPARTLFEIGTNISMKRRTKTTSGLLENAVGTMQTGIGTVVPNSTIKVTDGESYDDRNEIVPNHETLATRAFT